MNLHAEWVDGAILGSRSRSYFHHRAVTGSRCSREFARQGKKLMIKLSQNISSCQWLCVYFDSFNLVALQFRNTALDWALENKQTEAVEVLLARGAQSRY